VTLHPCNTINIAFNVTTNHIIRLAVSTVIFLVNSKITHLHNMLCVPYIDKTSFIL